MLLTESFSVTGIVFFAYFLIDYVQTKNKKMLTISILLSLFLTMLRPSALYLFIVIGIIMIPYTIDMIKRIINKEKTNKEIVPLITLAVCIASLVSYMNFNKSQNGYHGLSYVSEINKFYDIVQAEIWNDNQDREIVQRIIDFQDEGRGVLGSAIAVEEELRTNGNKPERLIQFNEEAIANHKSEYAIYLLKKSLIMGSNNMSHNLTTDSNFLKEDTNRDTVWLGDYLDFNVNFVYFIFLLSCALIVTILIKRKKLLADILAISLIIGGQLGVNILAGPAEFHRLNVPCYPFSLLLIIIGLGLVIDTYSTSKTSENSQQVN